MKLQVIDFDLYVNVNIYSNLDLEASNSLVNFTKLFVNDISVKIVSQTHIANVKNLIIYNSDSYCE